MFTDQQWLRIGVVHEFLLGLLFAWLFLWYARVPYPFEVTARGALRGFWTSVRWFMGLVWGAYGLVHFFAAYWLVNYILTQPISE